MGQGKQFKGQINGPRNNNFWGWCRDAQIPVLKEIDFKKNKALKKTNKRGCYRLRLYLSNQLIKKFMN